MVLQWEAELWRHDRGREWDVKAGSTDSPAISHATPVVRVGHPVIWARVQQTHYKPTN